MNHYINFEKFTPEEMQEWHKLMAKQYNNALGTNLPLQAVPQLHPSAPFTSEEGKQPESIQKVLDEERDFSKQQKDKE